MPVVGGELRTLLLCHFDHILEDFYEPFGDPVKLKLFKSVILLQFLAPKESLRKDFLTLSYF